MLGRPSVKCLPRYSNERLTPGMLSEQRTVSYLDPMQHHATAKHHESGSVLGSFGNSAKHHERTSDTKPRAKGKENDPTKRDDNAQETKNSCTRKLSFEPDLDK